MPAKSMLRKSSSNYLDYLGSVMEKMIVGMVVMSPQNMHVVHPMLSANQDSGRVQDSLTFVLTKIRSVMTILIVQIVPMKAQYVTMHIVITTEDSVLMDVYKLRLEHCARVQKEKL